MTKRCSPTEKIQRKHTVARGDEKKKKTRSNDSNATAEKFGTGTEKKEKKPFASPKHAPTTEKGGGKKKRKGINAQPKGTGGGTGSTG